MSGGPYRNNEEPAPKPTLPGGFAADGELDFWERAVLAMEAGPPVADGTVEAIAHRADVLVLIRRERIARGVGGRRVVS